MTRKGELTRGRLNREFPHHVALPAEKVRGAENSEAIWSFGRSVSMAQLTYDIRRGDNDYVVVYCFKEELPFRFPRYQDPVDQNKKAAGSLGEASGGSGGGNLRGYA
jgi:hypothetical protein